MCVAKASPTCHGHCTVQDESVSVREAAVDLLGKHISSSQDLALKYFGLLSMAVRDEGISVRKRAINIMWESCINTLPARF